MLGVFYRSKDELAVTEVDDPRIVDASDVLVRVRACGICGTDIKMLHGEYEGTTPPVILGHEFSGEVTKVGPAVKNLNAGDRVVVDPNLTCGSCYYCRRSQENLCTHMVTTGMNRNGGMAEYCRVPSSTVHVVPSGLPFEVAAFSEPLACVLNGVERAEVAPGDTVGVVGLGPIGILFARVLERKGAAKVVGFEVSQDRAVLARQLGLSSIINPTSPRWREEVNELTAGRGVDVAIDAAGSPAASRTAIEAVRRGGRVVIFGIPPPGARLEIDSTRLVTSELEIKGSFIDRFTFPSAIRMLAEGKIDVQPLISNTFGLVDAPEAFGIVARGNGMKVQIRP
ncbi:MAG: zinc-dependent alcohol dehydrogenase family protein [Thaumarchaeota archaeon]|nr:zinc-dependent alcohol dehydrogenase family protein [Nitrososphaerota archaeon]